MEDKGFKYDSKELMESIMREGYKFPISSSKLNLSNKGVDYKVLLLLTLLSNRNTDEQICENGQEDAFRYIYRNKLKHYQDLVEDLSNTKLTTIIKTINKMSKLDCKVIGIRKTGYNDIVYDIIYKNNNREYVTIDTKIIKTLIHSFNSNAIKVYILLSYMCKNGKRSISRQHIINEIGLSDRSNNNHQLISDITDELHLGGYINKETKYIDYNDSKCFYEVNNIDNWDRLRKERLKS